MDGTFKCAAKYFTQLYTLHGFQNGHYIPLVFALLNGKTENAYRILLNQIISLCSGHGLIFNPEYMNVDFEAPVLNVIRELLPNSTIRCCRFHYGQSIWRKIQSLGLASEYKSRSEIGKWLICFFGLPFLNAQDVGDCFAEDLMPNMPNMDKCIKFADYIVDTYVSEESRYPSDLWAETPFQ